MSVDNNSFGYYGYVAMGTLNPGDTLLHTFWSFSAWGTWGSLSTFPIGSSICRAGIIVADALAVSPPTPITNEGDPWIDMTTVHPHGQIATSTNVDWSYLWDTGLGDRDSVVHRQNDNVSGTLSLWLGWEFDVAPNAVSGFAVGGWNCSVDAYIDTH
ncbi:MAG: hypothetical protein ACRDRO_30175 [Pseudonocardiaceae bacterium]